MSAFVNSMFAFLFPVGLGLIMIGGLWGKEISYRHQEAVAGKKMHKPS